MTRAEAKVGAGSRADARKVVAAPAHPRGGRPTKKAAEELGQRILATAARLFSAQGFAATSMEQVAIACGAGKDTIYRRYPSKGALFTALMEQLRASVVAEIDAALEPESAPLDRLKSYARRLLAINLRPDMLALNRVALAEAVPSGGVQAPTGEDDPFMVRFAYLVAAAQAKGQLAAGDPLFIADQLLYATSIKPMIRAMLGDRQFAEAGAQDSYFEQAWSLVLAGVARS